VSDDTSPTANFWEIPRINITRGLGLTQGHRLDLTTVKDDFAIDSLSGEKGVDWLFASLGATPDRVVSASSDVVTNV